MPRSTANPLALVARRALHWAPVWVPALLLWQVTSRGLFPALEERDRLRAAGPEVRAMEEQHATEYEELSNRVEAQDDPIYRARVERLEARRLAAREEAIRESSARDADGGAGFDGIDGDGDRAGSPPDAGE
jgi:hypothetical protein